MSFHKKVLISLTLAFVVGLWANQFNQGIGESVPWVNALNQICEFVGKLFLNGLKMVVIPLVLTSVICGVSQISSDRDFGRLGNENLDDLFPYRTACSLHRASLRKSDQAGDCRPSYKGSYPLESGK